MKKALMICAAMVAMTFFASAQNVGGYVKVKGRVFFPRTEKTTPSINIAVLDDSETIATQIIPGGEFTLLVKPGKYTISFMAQGYRRLMMETDCMSDIMLEDVVLEEAKTGLEDITIITAKARPVEAGNPNAPTQKMKIEGANVIVR